MMVVDSSVIVAIVKKEPEEQLFFDLLDASSMNIMSAGTLQETFIVLIRSQIDVAQAQRVIDACEISIIPVDESLAHIAANAFSRFGRGQDHPARLNFGDCFAYALAKARDLPLLFKGDDFSKTDIRDARIALA